MDSLRVGLRRAEELGKIERRFWFSLFTKKVRSSLLTLRDMRLRAVN